MYSIVSWDTVYCIRARYWGDEHGMWNYLDIWKIYAELSPKYLTVPSTNHLGSSELPGRTALMAITEIEYQKFTEFVSLRISPCCRFFLFRRGCYLFIFWCVTGLLQRSTFHAASILYKLKVCWPCIVIHLYNKNQQDALCHAFTLTGCWNSQST
jgi:hypothetical protein